MGFVYHCFDRIVIRGYLTALSRPELVVHFFREIVARASAYSAGAANRSSIGTVMGAACPRNRRQAILMSRNNLTPRHWACGNADANSQFVSNGCQ